jgi:hypothetical protein
VTPVHALTARVAAIKADDDDTVVVDLEEITGFDAHVA